MPTYDYECDNCQHAFELFQSITDPVKRKCPECGRQKLRRLFGTGAALVFKGSGFYETDYRSDSYKKAAEAEKKSSESSKSDSGGDAAKSSKPKTEGSKGSAASDSKGSSPSNKPKKQD